MSTLIDNLGVERFLIATNCMVMKHVALEF